MDQESVLSSTAIPDRPGWFIETIIDQTYRISVIVRHGYTKSGWLIASLDPLGRLIFSIADSTPDASSDVLILARTVLQKIDLKDITEWPTWDLSVEYQKPFWKDYVKELPNVIIVAQVLMS